MSSDIMYHACKVGEELDVMYNGCVYRVRCVSTSVVDMERKYMMVFQDGSKKYMKAEELSSRPN